MRASLLRESVVFIGTLSVTLAHCVFTLLNLKVDAGGYGANDSIGVPECWRRCAAETN
jgi:hypothetical protein